MGDSNYTKIESDERYNSVETICPQRTTAGVLEVKLLGIERKTEPVPEIADEEDISVIIHLGLECMVGSDEKIRNIERVHADQSIESPLNPTDMRYVVNTGYDDEDLETLHVGFEDNQFIKMKFEHTYRKYHGENCVRTDENIIYHLSFLDEFGAWQMYRIDMRNPDRIKFKFVDTYLYIQGKAIKSRPGCLAKYRKPKRR